MAAKVGVSPLDYGATDDGTTDDTTAVLNALAAAKTDKTRCLYLDSTFLCNVPLRVDLNNFSIRGASASTCGIKNNQLGPAIIVAVTAPRNIAFRLED